MPTHRKRSSALFFFLALSPMACGGELDGDGETGSSQTTAGGLGGVWFACDPNDCSKHSSGHTDALVYSIESRSAEPVRLQVMDLRADGTLMVVMGFSTVTSPDSSTWDWDSSMTKRGRWEKSDQKLTLFVDGQVMAFEYARVGPGLRLIGLRGKFNYYEQLKPKLLRSVLIETPAWSTPRPAGSLAFLEDKDGHSIPERHWIQFSEDGTINVAQGTRTGDVNPTALARYPFATTKSSRFSDASPYFAVACVGVGTWRLEGSVVTIEIGGYRDVWDLVLDMANDFDIQGRTCEEYEECKEGWGRPGIVADSRYLPFSPPLTPRIVCERFGVVPVDKWAFDPSSW